MEDTFDVEDTFAVEQQFSSAPSAAPSNDAIRDLGDMTVSPVHIRRNKYTRRRSRRKTGRARMVSPSIYCLCEF